MLCFFIKIILDENGECDGFIIFVVKSFCMCCLIFFIMVGGICWYFCLKGVGFVNFIWCCILFVLLMLIEFVEKMFWYFLISFWYFCFFELVREFEIFILLSIYFNGEFGLVLIVFVIEIGCILYKSFLGGIDMVCIVILFIFIGIILDFLKL